LLKCKCGFKVPDRAKFCPECGRMIQRPEPKPEPKPEAQEHKPQNIYTVKTAAKEFFQGAIGETKLRELINKGEIPCSRFGVKILLREESLIAWMAEQEKKSIATAKPLRLAR